MMLFLFFCGFLFFHLFILVDQPSSRHTRMRLAILYTCVYMTVYVCKLGDGNQ